MKTPRLTSIALASAWLLTSLPYAAFGQVVGVGDCTITRHPVSTSVCPGDPVQLQVSFTGEPTAVQWFRGTALVATQDLPAGGVATLTDIPPLEASDGTYHDAVYRAVLVCGTGVVESNEATVSPASGKWGSFDVRLGGAARFAASASTGQPVLDLTNGGTAVIALAGAASAKLDCSPASVAALSNTDAEGSITYSARAVPQRKGWDGTVKGGRATEITARRTRGRATFSDFTLRCDGPGGAPRVCVFNGAVMLSQFTPGPECLVSAAAANCDVLLSNASGANEGFFDVAVSKVYLQWGAPTEMTVQKADGTLETFTATRVSYTVPVPAARTGMGAGKVSFSDLHITRLVPPYSPTNPPPPLLEFAHLEIKQDTILEIDETFFTGSPYSPPNGLPPVEQPSTSVLSLNERSRNCNPPPFVGSWNEPGLLVSPAPGLAAEATYGVTLTGAAMECEDLMLRLTPPAPAQAAGACFALQSWSWGESLAGGPLFVQAEPSQIKLTPDAAGYELRCDGGISAVDDWQVTFKNGGVIKGTIIVNSSSRVCSVAALPTGVGKVSVQDISFMKFAPGTMVSWLAQGVPVTQECDQIVMTRLITGFIPRAHAALRLEACCLPPFEITGTAIAHRVHQWGDAVITTSQNSPGARSSRTSRGWNLKEAIKRTFPVTPTAPLGLADPSVPVARVQKTRTKSNNSNDRVIGPLPGSAARGPRACVADFEDCDGLVLSLALDTDTSVTLPPPAAPRTCVITHQGRLLDSSGSPVSAFTFADVPPEPDGGMSLTPAFNGAATYRLVLKNGGTVVYDQGGLSGEACRGLPRSFTCKPCPQPDPAHPDAAAVYSFSWGLSQQISTGSGGGGAGLVVFADEVQLTPEGGTSGPVVVEAFTSVRVQCTNVHDLTLRSLDLLRHDVKRSTRTLMSAVGNAYVSDNVDEDCDDVGEVADGWLFAGRPALSRITTALASPGDSSKPASSRHSSMNAHYRIPVVFHTAAPGEEDGLDLLTGEAEVCSWSFGASNAGYPGNIPHGAGRVTAVFNRPGGMQEWGVTTMLHPSGGCILRPEIPVPASFRLSVWDGGDPNGGCTPSGEDIIVSSVPDIMVSAFPDGMGFQCNAARTAEPDIVIILFPFPVQMSVAGQTRIGSVLEIAPRPVDPVMAGPISRIKIRSISPGRYGAASLHGIVVQPISPRHVVSHGTSTTGGALFQTTWFSPSARPVVSAELEKWEGVLESEIEQFPGGALRYSRSYPPPDRFFEQLIDLGWEWPPVPQD